MKQATRIFALLLAALALMLGVAACGGDDGNDTVSGTFEPLAGAPAAYDNLSGEAELSRGDGETTTSISLDGLEPDTEYMAHLHVEGCEAADPGGAHFQFDPNGGEEPPNEIHLSFTSNGDGSGEAEVTSKGEVPEGEAGSVVLHLGAHSAMSALRFVHEGEHHGDAQEGSEHGEAPDKIACADLEGSGSTGAAGGAVPTIEVRDGEPVGGIAKLEFDAGEQVRFKVKGDEAEEIHVHGYDLMKDIPEGGGTVEFDFPAEIEGIFEAELEGKGVQILELQVNP